MTNTWCREIRTENSAVEAGLPDWIKKTAMYLENIVDYHFVTQSIAAAANTFNTASESGSSAGWNLGVGQEWEFSASAYTFTTDNVNDWILVKYPNTASDDYKACGWYRITNTGSVSSNCILDYRAHPLEYPPTGTNLEWWLLPSDYGVTSVANGDYCILRTPHARNWELKLTYYEPSANQWQIKCEVSPNGVWSGGSSKVLGPSYMSFLVFNASTHFSYKYMHANLEGTFFMMWCHNFNGVSSNAYQGFLISHITPFEQGHSNDELVALAGGDRTTYNFELYSNINRFAHATSYPEAWGNNVKIWRDAQSTFYDCRMVEYCDNLASNGFATYDNNENNVRTGKLDLISGSPVMMDPENSSNLYEFVGILGGHYSGRDNYSVRTALNHSGTYDKYHIANGFYIDWPNVTPQW